MGLFRKLQKVAADVRKAEEALYAMAMEEVTSGDLKPGLWAKAFADSEGSEARAKALYLKLRVQTMKDELASMDRAFTRFQRECGSDDEPASTGSARRPSASVPRYWRASAITSGS